MRPGPGSRALATVIADLAATGDGATAERLWGVAQPVFDGGHPQVGRSVPDVHLADGRRMELLRGAGVLLDDRRFVRPDQ